MFDSAATHLVMAATPTAVGGSNLLHAAMDPLAMFLLGGGVTLFAALCYGIHSSWKDEVAGPHRLYEQAGAEAPPQSPVDAVVAPTESASTTAAADGPRLPAKLAS